MALHLCDAKVLIALMVIYHHLYHYKQISSKLEAKFQPFLQENAFENVVCKKSVITGDKKKR